VKKLTNAIVAPTADMAVDTIKDMADTTKDMADTTKDMETTTTVNIKQFCSFDFVFQVSPSVGKSSINV
jgi:hypothetical protein